MNRGCSILLALLVSAACHAGDPLDTWHWRNPTPLGVPLGGVCFGNDLFVAVGNAGTILVSPDGANWVARESGTLVKLRDVTFGNGLFVAVGDDGAILTSTDTRTWMRQTTSVFADLYSVTYGNGLFVAVGDATFILSSPDGTNWTQRASGTIPLLDVAYGNGLFVAVGSQGSQYVPLGNILLTSPDGFTWTAREPLVGGRWKAVTHGNGRFVIAVHGLPYSEMTTFMTSEDGIGWESKADSFYAGGGVTALAFGNGGFAAFAGSPSYYSLVHWQSKDGLKWSQISNDTYTLSQSAVFGRDRFVAVGGRDDSFGLSSSILTVTGETNAQSQIKGNGIYPGGFPASRLIHAGDRFFAFAGFDYYLSD